MTENNPLFQRIAEEHGLIIKGHKSLSGGDINDVYLIEGEERLVLKLNSSEKFPGMFEAEKKGLEVLKSPNLIDVPSPLFTGTIDFQSYLILEYREQGNKSKNFWSDFGEQMAQLHQCSQPDFGFEIENYIGSLPQYNDSRNSAADFYIDMRLKPQIKIAKDQGYDLEIGSAFFENIRKIIPDEPSALVHGDLWGGNYLVNSKGNSCLIDPATAFAPREMDIGMMHLFGGFSEDLFHTYNEIYPLESGWQERLPVWQLYYLLVHLNIFGSSYLSQVTSIIRKYS